jgi:TolB-like protein/DNA-binding winged helix-turn-helix (wHTH) protein/Tfp pilus assembly protein PilF
MPEPLKRFYEFEAYRLDPSERLLTCNGQAIPLTPKAFETLLVLVENSGQAVTKDALIARVWPDAYVEEATLAQNIFTLRKLFSENSQHSQFIETIPKYGYRFVVEVNQRTDAATATQPASRASNTSGKSANIKSERLFEENAEPTGEVFAGKRRRFSLVILGSCLLVIAVVTLIFWRTNRPQDASQAEIRKIAVLPFRTLSVDSRDEAFELGMADSLITKLSNIKQVTVRSIGAVSKYNTPQQDSLVAGRELNVQAVLEGSTQKAGERIRVNVRLLNVETGSALWTGQFDEKFTDIFKIQDSISEQITRALALTLTGEERQLLAKRYTENTEAYDLYQRGRFLWNKRTETDYQKAIEQFRAAIALDKNYALAYAGLADSFHLLGDYGYLHPNEAFLNAKEAAIKALEIDPSLAEAHTSLAYAKFLFDWDWPVAEREFQKAIDLNPSYATAHQWYAEYKAAMGRFDEALAGIKKAQEVEPNSAILNAELGWVYYIARDYDQAIETCKEAIRTEKDFYPAYFWLGQAYEKKAFYKEAIVQYQTAANLSASSPEVLASLAHAYAASGDKNQAEKILQDLQLASKSRFVSPYYIALIYAGLRDRAQMLAWLEKAFQGHSRSMPFLNVDPMFDELRSDAKFQDLLRRVSAR